MPLLEVTTAAVSVAIAFGAGRSATNTNRPWSHEDPWWKASGEAFGLVLGAQIAVHVRGIKEPVTGVL